MWLGEETLLFCLPRIEWPCLMQTFEPSLGKDRYLDPNLIFNLIYLYSPMLPTYRKRLSNVFLSLIIWLQKLWANHILALLMHFLFVWCFVFWRVWILADPFCKSQTNYKNLSWFFGYVPLIGMEGVILNSVVWKDDVGARNCMKRRNVTKTTLEKKLSSWGNPKLPEGNWKRPDKWMSLVCPWNSKKDNMPHLKWAMKVRWITAWPKYVKKWRVWGPEHRVKGLPLPEAYEFRCRWVHCWWENEEFLSLLLFS